MDLAGKCKAPKIISVAGGAVEIWVAGTAVGGDETHWKVSCPFCERDIECGGYFDSSEINHCRCGCDFFTKKIWIDEDHYIE